MESPKARTTATAVAAGATSQNANKGSEHCSMPLGTVVIQEDTQSNWYRYLTMNWNLSSTVPVLRVLAQ